MYCTHCGHEIAEGSNFCQNCGARIRKESNVCNRPAKSQVGAGLLGIFLGMLGIHNFYLGHIMKGCIQLFLTLGGLILMTAGLFSFDLERLLIASVIAVAIWIAVWVWALIEAILIFAGKMRDGRGNELV